MALETKAHLQSLLTTEIATDLVPFTEFYLAEDYHQKHALQNSSEYLQELKSVYSSFREIIFSTAAARLNGYLGGYGLYIIPGRKPMSADSVQLRLIVTANSWTAQFRPDSKSDFETTGRGTLPESGDDQVSNQCYNGPPDAERWMRFDDFRYRSWRSRTTERHRKNGAHGTRLEARPFLEKPGFFNCRGGAAVR